MIEKINNENLTRAKEADFKKGDYHKKLTQKLGDLHLNIEQLDLSTLYEIVLWKLDRVAELEPSIDRLKEARNIQINDCESTINILNILLNSKGIGLPMASTILRFMNPTVFQIIDDRVYRFLYSGEEYKYKWNNLKPRYELAKNDEKIKIYCDYLTDLRKASNENNINFFDADRVFYFYDIFEDNKVGKGPWPQKNTESKNT